LTEEEAWRKVEKIHMDLTKDKSSFVNSFIGDLINSAKECGFEVGEVLSFKDEYCDGHLILELKKDGDLEKLKEEVSVDDVDIIIFNGVRALGFWWVNC